MIFRERDQSGLLVPSPPPAPPKPPEPWSLEFENEHDRQRARQALRELFSLCDRGQIRIPGWEQNALRKRLVLHLAELLVGEIEFEEKC